MVPASDRLSVSEQESMIARLDAVSRARALSVRESALLADLLERQGLRERVRKWRLAGQRQRAAARLAQLVGGFGDAIAA